MKNKTDSKLKGDYLCLQKGLRGLIFRDKDPFRRDLFHKYLKCNLNRSVVYYILNSNYFFKFLSVIFFYISNYTFLNLKERKDFVTILVHSNEVSDFNQCIIYKNDVSCIKKCFSGCLNFQNINIELSRFKKLTRIFKLLLKKYDFYIVLRSAEYIAYYSKMYALFSKKSIKGVLNFTDSNPHGFALMFIAQRLKIPHYFISCRGEPHPPLVQIKSKGVFLLGKNSLKMYENVASQFGKVFYKGHKQDYKIYQHIRKDQIITLGIFLGKMSTLKYLNSLLATVSSQMNVKYVLIRSHPNSIFSEYNNIRKLIPNHLTIIKSTSFLKDIKICDLIFTGNTGALLDALLFGKASIFCKELEEIYYDVYGYVKDGLSICWDKDLTLKEINDFYSLIDSEIMNKRLNLTQSFNLSRDNFNSYVFDKIIDT